MNEWIGIAVSSVAAVVGALSLFILHDLHDRIVRLEKSCVQTEKALERVQGRCDALFPKNHSRDDEYRPYRRRANVLHLHVLLHRPPGSVRDRAYEVAGRRESPYTHPDSPLRAPMVDGVG